MTESRSMDNDAVRRRIAAAAMPSSPPTTPPRASASSNSTELFHSEVPTSCAMGTRSPWRSM